MKKLLVRGAIAVGALAFLLACAVVAYDRWGYEARAEKAGREGHFDETIRIADEALTYPIWTSAYRARMLVYRGAAAMSLGNPDQALKDLGEALKLNPKNVDALILSNAIFMERHEWAAAMKNFDKTVALEPDNTEIRAMRADLAAKVLDLDKAFADYDMLTKLYPQNDLYFKRAAYVLAYKRETDKAAAFIEAMPMDGSHRATAYLRRANQFDSIGAHDRALLDYAQAIRLAPKDARLYVERGISYSSAGKSALAIADLNRSIELKPEQYEAWYTRGREYYLAGQYSKARSDLQHALTLFSQENYGLIWLHLANARLGIEDKDAIKEWLAASPDTSWPRPLLEFFAGKSNENTLRDAAIANVSPDVAAASICETNYYVSALYLIEGQRSKAVPLLHEAVAKCPPDYVEFRAAQRELKALGE